MKQVFITGSSKGLGKALAQAYLENGDIVHGLSRSCSIESKHYFHHQIDLTDLAACNNFSFELEPAAEAYILINNAGTLGEMKQLGSWTAEAMQSVFQLNVMAPLLLSQQFYKVKPQASKKRFVLHIGSGAGEKPLDGWMQYCASKSALHMASRVMEEELKLGNKQHFEQRVLSPGVIDTPMQAEIRKADKQHFSHLERFKEYKKTDNLKDAGETARKIIRNFNRLFASDEPIQYLKNYQ
jgi:benzil reductase ((S)-benzoin forming)